MNCSAHALLYQICNEVGRPPSGMVSIARIKNSKNNVLREKKRQPPCVRGKEKEKGIPFYHCMLSLNKRVILLHQKLMGNHFCQEFLWCFYLETSPNSVHYPPSITLYLVP